jgi:hypothetical protein
LILHSVTSDNSITGIYQHYFNGVKLYRNYGKTKELERLDTVILCYKDELNDYTVEYMHNKYLSLPHNCILFDRYKNFESGLFTFCANYHSYMKFSILGKHLKFSTTEFKSDIGTMTFTDSDSNIEFDIYRWCELHNLELNFCYGFQ